jgi:hypothetical protein
MDSVVHWCFSKAKVQQNVFHKRAVHAEIVNSLSLKWAGYPAFAG